MSKPTSIRGAHLPALEDQFSDAAIVRRLIALRVEGARQRRRNVFLSSLLGLPNPQARDRVAALLPPRSQWHRCRPRLEHRRDPTRSSVDYLKSGLLRHVLRELNVGSGYRWSRRLQGFMQEIRQGVEGWNANRSLTPTSIVPVPKGRPGNNQKYRIISVYGLHDRIWMAGFSAYLRALLEPVLGECCLAFRAPPPGCAPPTHHDAISRIQEYRHRRDDSDLIWVSECDIQGFFDSVSHDVARKAIRSALLPTSCEVDGRLWSFLESFFRGFRYVGGATEEARAVLRQEGVTQPVFADPVRALEQNGIAPPPGDIGVPQGAAVSCVLANVVLHSADQVVNRSLIGSGSDSLYMRYCDDILVLSTGRGPCQDALDSYIRELHALRLPLHLPIEISTYNRSFWSAKSKRPYRWAASSRGGSTVPWLSFVGYQVNRDGRVRVRKSSIDKELTKQRQVLVDLRTRLASAVSAGRATTLPPAYVFRRRVEAHLISIGVGYPSPRGPGLSSVSWCAGFEALSGERVAEGGLRRLDRGRVRVLDDAYRLAEGFLTNELVSERSPTEPRNDAPHGLEPQGDCARFSYVHYFRRGKPMVD